MTDINIQAVYYLMLNKAKLELIPETYFGPTIAVSGLSHGNPALSVYFKMFQPKDVGRSSVSLAKDIIAAMR